MENNELELFVLTVMLDVTRQLAETAKGHSGSATWNDNCKRYSTEMAESCSWKCGWPGIIEDDGERYAN